MPSLIFPKWSGDELIFYIPQVQIETMFNYYSSNIIHKRKSNHFSLFVCHKFAKMWSFFKYTYMYIYSESTKSKAKHNI